MHLKFNRDEITWIKPEFLTKDVTKDIAGFWVDTSDFKLCIARYEDDGSIAHYWFNEITSQWELL